MVCEFYMVGKSCQGAKKNESNQVGLPWRYIDTHLSLSS